MQVTRADSRHTISCRAPGSWLLAGRSCPKCMAVQTGDGVEPAACTDLAGGAATGDVSHAGQ